MKIDLNNKKFKALSNTENGEVSEETIFHYHQKGDIVWAEYSGGSILKGQILGKITRTGQLDIRYHHLNVDGEILTGKCISNLSKNQEGRIKLIEEWEWTCKDKSSGESVLIEI